MKRKQMILLFFVSLCTGGWAQQWNLDFSYKYLYSGQWDKAIQTYNFSRPFLPQKQPLLMHGFGASGSTVFKGNKPVKHGMKLSYSLIRSAAENESFNNTLNLHFAEIGYVMHYELTGKWNRFYTEVALSAVGSGLFRKINGEAFVYDEKPSRAFGIGGNLQVLLGYSVPLKNRVYWSPWISFGYAPYLYSPNTEAVINQTKGLSGKNSTALLSGQIGCAFQIKKKSN